MRLNLPDRTKDKVGTFPESSYGAHLVTLVFDDGTRSPLARIAEWDEIVDDPVLGLKGLDSSRIVASEPITTKRFNPC